MRHMLYLVFTLFSFVAIDAAPAPRSPPYVSSASNIQYVSTLWITDLNGTLQHKILLDGQYTLAYGCAMNGTTLYAAGVGAQAPQNLISALWNTDLSGTNKATSFLNTTLGSSASSCAANANNCFIVGPHDGRNYGDYTPHATLWITDAKGGNLQTINLDNTAGTYAAGCAINANKCFSTGYGEKTPSPKQALAALWITDLSGGNKQTVYLGGVTDEDTSGYGMTVNASNCFIAGSGYNSTSYTATLWVTDLNGGNSTQVALDNLGDTSALDCAVNSTHCYVVGVGSPDQQTTYSATLWITDLNGSNKTAIYLDHFNGSGATSIALNDSNCFITGGTSFDGNNPVAPVLWITDLNGGNQKTFYLDGQMKGGSGYGCLLNGNSCYIIGQGGTIPTARMWGSQIYSPFKPL